MTFDTYEDEERAAIHEFDGKCTRKQAEHLTMTLKGFSPRWCMSRAKSLLAQAGQAKGEAEKAALTERAQGLIAYARGMEASA